MVKECMWAAIQINEYTCMMKACMWDCVGKTVCKAEIVEAMDLQEACTVRVYQGNEIEDSKSLLMKRSVPKVDQGLTFAFLCFLIAF